MANQKVADAVREGINQPHKSDGAQETPPPPDAIAAQQGGAQPDKEELERYGQLINNVSKIIDGEKGMGEGHQKLMQMLEQGKDNPGVALGEAVFSVGETVMKHAEAKGIEIPDEMLIAAAMDSLIMLSDLAGEAGFFEASEEDFANGYGVALLKFMQTHPDKVDWQSLQTAIEQADPQAVEAAKTMYNAQPAQAGQQQGVPAQQQAPPAGAQPGGIIGGGMA